jgi:hypothetical protein
LDVAHNAVGFEDEVISAVVDLRLKELDAVDAVPPEVSHDLTGEEVFEEDLTVGGVEVVRTRVHEVWEKKELAVDSPNSC